MSDVDKQKKRKTLCHGTCERTLTLNSANFYKSKRKDCVKYDYFYPVCKSCMEKIMLDGLGRVTQERFKTICKHLDIVFIEPLYKEALIKNNLEKNQMKVLGDYRALLTMNTNYRDLCYEDSCRFEHLVTQSDNIKEEAKPMEEVSQELIDFWGEGLEPKMYRIYQKEYDILCIQDGGNVQGVKQNYFKNLAILTHTAQQQLLQNDLKGHEITMKTYTAICEKCGINPKQIQDKDDSNRGTFGVFIRMIEDEEPIFDAERDLGKIDLVRRCLEVFFFGHLAEVNGWRNPLKCKYDEVMQEYSVKVDTYSDLMAIEENDEEVEKPKKIKKVRTSMLKGLRKKLREET